MKTKHAFIKAVILLAGLSFVLASTSRVAAQQMEDRDIYIPTTISKDAQEALRKIAKARTYAIILPAPGDLDAWRKARETTDEAEKEDNEKAVVSNGVTVAEANSGGVPVLDIRPANWKDNGKVLVYTHGGAYTMYSARSTLTSAAPMSRATGLRVISVDYTTAPFAGWSQIQEQVVSVFKALLAGGYAMKDIALFGDSAGGGLAISTALNLRDSGMGMPAAVLLWSPWADLSNDDDTSHTLKDADPTLTYDPSLKNSALAYAGGLDLKDPRVSPLFADFSRGFPPALIQDGTKGIFLSASARLYQTLKAAGQPAELDIYEGMWHVFQMYGVPESEVAITRSAAFINRHLKE